MATSTSTVPERGSEPRITRRASNAAVIDQPAAGREPARVERAPPLVAFHLGVGFDLDLIDAGTHPGEPPSPKRWQAVNHHARHHREWRDRHARWQDHRDWHRDLGTNPERRANP